MDYFMVSRGVAAAGAKAQVSLDVDAAPHRPVTMRAAWQQATIPTLMTTRFKLIDRVCGPLPARAAAGPRIASDMKQLLAQVKDAGKPQPVHALNRKQTDQGKRRAGGRRNERRVDRSDACVRTPMNGSIIPRGTHTRAD